MPAMFDIYRRYRGEYDHLVNAEDHEGQLPALLADWRHKTVLKGGLGTGRITGLYVEYVRHVVGFDRKDHMLGAACQRLKCYASKLELGIADNPALPPPPVKADIFIEG